MFAFKHFIIISAPGSGKGTFSQHFVEKFNYIQLSPGDIFRNEVRLQTDLGKKIQPIAVRGNLVYDDIVCDVMKNHLIEILAQKRYFILDGFPRSINSFHFLHNFIQEYGIADDVCFIQLLANDAICINRILERQVCVKCFKVYNKSLVKPQVSNQCDKCKIDLIVRPADNEQEAKKRLEYFHAHIEPVIELCKQFYGVQIINSEEPLGALKTKYDNLINVSCDLKK